MDVSSECVIGVCDGECVCVCVCVCVYVCECLFWYLTSVCVIIANQLLLVVSSEGHTNHVS